MDNKENITWKDIKYFSKKEFECKDGSRACKMNMHFVKRLDEIREEFGKMIITSGYRTPSWNLKIGGVPNSAHTKGLAADVLCETSSKRFKLVKIAIEKGIRRIGIGKDFIHLDMDRSKPWRTMWTYYKKK